MRAHSKTITAVVLACAFAIVASAVIPAVSDGASVGQTFTEDGIRYSVHNNSEVNVINNNLTKYSGNLIIPDHVSNGGKTYVVAGVWNMAFTDCVDLLTVSLPASVRDIGSGAFSDCAKLTGVSLPDGLKSINNNMFSRCHALKDVNMPSKLEKIGDSAFEGCNSLKEIVLPETVKSLGAFAFADCGKLERLVLPSGLAVLPRNCLNGCDSLKEIALPDGLKSIEKCALYNVKSLTGISIPEGVAMDDWVFCNADSLRTIVIGEDVTLKGETFLGMTFHGKDGSVMDQQDMSGKSFKKTDGKWIQSVVTSDGVGERNSTGPDLLTIAVTAIVIAALLGGLVIYRRMI